jgi:hypothetical protein
LQKRLRRFLDLPLVVGEKRQEGEANSPIRLPMALRLLQDRANERLDACLNFRVAQN